MKRITHTRYDKVPCDGYCGEFCVNKKCPIAMNEEYGKKNFSTITDCSTCPHYGGCVDCAFHDTNLCIEYKGNTFLSEDNLSKTSSNADSQNKNKDVENDE